MSDIMDQFKNAAKTLGREHSKKKYHGIFSQTHEESSDYESEDYSDQPYYDEYVGKSKVGKNSVSLFKDFLHLSSSHSIPKSSKSKNGINFASVNYLYLGSQKSQSSSSVNIALNSSNPQINQAQNSSAQPRASTNSISAGLFNSSHTPEASVCASPISVPHLSPENHDDTGDHSAISNQTTLERHHSPGGSDACSNSSTPPLNPIATSVSVSSKFKDLLLPPVSISGRRSSVGSHKSSSADDQPPSRSSSELNLKEKYGNLSNVLGKGAFATVKLCCPVGSKEKYAVKEFRKKKKDETLVWVLNLVFNTSFF